MIPKEKTKTSKRKRRCEICGDLKNDVETQINPYDEDIDGVIIKQAICSDCYNTLVDDI